MPGNRQSMLLSPASINLRGYLIQRAVSLYALTAARFAVDYGLHYVNWPILLRCCGYILRMRKQIASVSLSSVHVETVVM